MQARAALCVNLQLGVEGVIGQFSDTATEHAFPTAVQTAYCAQLAPFCCDQGGSGGAGAAKAVQAMPGGPGD